MTGGKAFTIILKGGFFSAIAATAISAALITFLYAAPNAKFSGAGDIARAILVMCAFTAVPAGSFGFIAGILGASWLRVRAPHIRSKLHLLAESLAIGLVLSLVFPALHSVMNWGTNRPELIGVKEFAFSLAVGIPCTVLFVLIFGSSLLQNTERITRSV